MANEKYLVSRAGYCRTGVRAAYTGCVFRTTDQLEDITSDFDVELVSSDIAHHASGLPDIKVDLP